MKFYDYFCRRYVLRDHFDERIYRAILYIATYKPADFEKRQKFLARLQAAIDPRGSDSKIVCLRACDWAHLVALTR